MMGRREGGQGRFNSFDLDKVVPPDHLVRQIDGVLDLGWVHKELAPYYSHTGRPSIDPVLMIRMLIVGYVFAIRSERRLCAEVQVNLAYRWFCQLGIEDRLPDHSVFCRARRGVRGCGGEVHCGRPGRRRSLLGRCEPDQGGCRQEEASSRRPADCLAEGRGSIPSAVREYLAALDAARSSEDNDDGDGGGSSGSRSKPAKEVSLTDPQAAWVTRPGIDPFFAYDANYLIDNKVGIIIDAEGTRANRVVEIAVTHTMADRVRRRFDLQPQRLAGDTVYGAAKLLKWLMDRKIAPHVPVWDKSARTDGTFSRADFVFDRERNVYVCPAGKLLTHSGLVDQGRLLPYRASRSDCSRCELKAQCTPSTSRKVTRDIDEDVRDRVRALVNTEAFQQSRRERKKIEMRFAHMKRILKLDRLRLRGLNGVKDEVLLTATAQNLRRLVKFLCRPPPIAAATCPA